MRYAKTIVAVAAVAGILATAPTASAFTAPSSIVPYMPANNVVTVSKLNSNIAGVDQYMCSTGVVLSVTANTPMSTVQKLAASNLAFSKFKNATLTAAQRFNPIQLQQATIWFMNNIGRPLYGL
jgi:hypothetical protein